MYTPLDLSFPLYMKAIMKKRGIADKDLTPGSNPGPLGQRTNCLPFSQRVNWRSCQRLIIYIDYSDFIWTFLPFYKRVIPNPEMVFSQFLSHLLIARCDIGVQLSVRSSVCPQFMSRCLLCSSDSWEYETLHSNYPWHTFQEGTLTQCPWPWFHAPLTLSKFCVESRKFTLSLEIISNKVNFFAAVLAVRMKPCIVIVLDTLFKKAPWPGALDLDFTLHWLCQNFASSLENLRRA